MENKRPPVLILGYGEIGKAIGQCYTEAGRNFFVRDLNDDGLKGHEVEVAFVHVALPNTPRFPEEAVKKVIEDTGKRALVIIHSTVEPGTTRRLQKETGHKFIVHSPVLGVHPDLFASLLNFRKAIGADFSGAGRLAAEEMESVGMTCEVLHGSKTTELAKLMDLLYRSVCITLHDQFEEWCQKEDVSYDRAVKEWNEHYNFGFKKLGKPEVVRPICFPPQGDLTGSHCQIPAALILKRHFGKNVWLDKVLEFNKDDKYQLKV